MNTLQRFGLLLVTSWLTACASGSGNRAAPAKGHEGVLITLRDYRAGTRLELASESHTDRVEYYSQSRRDAARKVQNDEVMQALVGELDRQGFDDHCQGGRAPEIAQGDVIRWGLEVEQGGQEAHWLIGPGSSQNDWKEFQECRDTFLQIYNITVSYQALENPSGKSFFEAEKARAAAEQKHR